MERDFQFSLYELEHSLSDFSKKGITSLSVSDNILASEKLRLINFLKSVLKFCPEIFISIKVNPEIIDKEVCSLAMQLNSSIEIQLLPSVKGDKNSKNKTVCFDKKLYSRCCTKLNDHSLIFGVSLFYADFEEDSFKSFKDRLDFSLFQYPNHINFPQLEEESQSARVSALFSGKDIRLARDIAFACKTFYSEGRAVPWFLSVLAPLKIQPSQFFADFAEWQRCNNCDFISGFSPEKTSHKEIEKMQSLFISIKYEERHLERLLPVVFDIIKLNGAFSRLAGEKEESLVELQYSPDDLLGFEASDIPAFYNDVCMENCTVSVFAGSCGPDYKIL